jgi:diaminopimelate decarboxylase
MLKFIAEVQSETGVLVEMLNLGGGIGVRYIEEHPKVEIDVIFEGHQKRSR